MKLIKQTVAAFSLAAALSFPSYAQLQTAGSLLINIDPGAQANGPIASIPNTGTAGGAFDATGLVDVDQPVIVNVGAGAKAIMFDGHNFMEHVDAPGGAIVPAPAGLVGNNPVCSIEAWVINPSLFNNDIETIVSWGQRETGLGLMTFGYSSQNDHGAVDRWGGNMAWNPVPAAAVWHHLVYTFDGTTTRIYADGVERGSLAGSINTVAGRPITLAAQRTPTGDLIGWGGARGSLSIGKLRIHSGALTASQVSSNYNAEKATFVFAPTPLAAKPLRRYSFNNAAGDAVGVTVPDTGTLAGDPAVVRGAAATATFTGTRVRLTGGSSATAPYVDLPNGLLTSLSSTASGSGQISLEGWLDVTGGQTWQRYFDFGATSEGELTDIGGGGTGRDYFSFTQVNTARDWARIETVNNGFGGGPGTVDLPSGASRDFGVQNGNAPYGMVHFAATWDEASGEIVVYQNGIETTRLVTDKKFDHINDVNVWLGRSNWTGDSNLQADYDEFRVYNRILTPAEVINNFVSGADAVAVAPGTLQSIRLVLSRTNGVVGNLVQATVFADYQNVTNVNVTSQAGVTYDVDTNRLQSLGGGAFRVLVEGLSSITASFGGQNSTGSVNVGPVTANAIHRYSFNDAPGSGTVVDSIGGVNWAGTVQGNATLDGTRLVLDGVIGDYVSLPEQILGDSEAVTIEAWASFGVNGAWARLFDFGDQNAAGVDGRTYIFVSPRDGGGAANLSVVGPSSAQSAVRPGTLNNQTNLHIVAVVDPASQALGLYVNGVRIAQNNELKVPLSEINDVSNFIGRSLFNADPHMAGSVDEFRIYSGTLTPQRIAINAAAGPNQTVVDPGALQTVALTLTNKLSPNTSVQGLFLGNFANVQGVNLFAYGTPTVSSDNTNVVTVSSNGLVRAVGLGTANVTFNYNGQIVARAITVETPAPVLRHRYSFSDTEGSLTAEDTVGDADGTLLGNAFITGGNLVLDAAGSYVELPAHLVQGYEALTFETWASLGVNGGWVRLWDFGSQNPGGGGETSLFFSPHIGPGGLEFTMFVPGRNNNYGASTNLDETTDVHIVGVYNPAAGYMELYINGVLAGANRNTTIQLSEINDVNNWIGRSQFNDPFLNGTIDEFRIYEGALSAAQVAANFAAGPNDTAVSLSVAHTGNSLRIAWPAGATGYVLQTSATVDGGWTNSNLPVTVEGGQNVVTDTIPTTAGAKFYRLIKPVTP